MTTPRASLPELSEAQASKEITHNEALRKLEALTVGGVVTMTLSAPPASPTEGGVWIVGPNATGAWSGMENKLAHFTNAAWAFYAPADGWNAYLIDANVFVFFDGTAWSTKFYLPASVAGAASLNLPAGAAPTTPADGDIWATTAALVARINGATRTLWDDGNLATVAQAEAEAGTATTPRAWTAQRVAQAIAALGSAIDTVQENIAAAGTTSATATAITARQAEVTSSTVGSAEGVRLPTIIQGNKVVVFNKTANAINVYPPTGKQINWAGVDVAHSLGAWGTVTYYATKADTYYT